MKKYLVVTTCEDSYDEWIDLETNSYHEALEEFNYFVGRMSKGYHIEIRKMANEFDYDTKKYW